MNRNACEHQILKIDFPVRILPTKNARNAAADVSAALHTAFHTPSDVRACLSVIVN